MHMTSQKGAPARWGSNEALPRAPSPSMKPAGQPLHAIPPGGPRPAQLRGWERQRSSSTTRARSPTSLDPQHGVVVMETWRQCIRSILQVSSVHRACGWIAQLQLSCQLGLGQFRDNTPSISLPLLPSAWLHSRAGPSQSHFQSSWRWHWGCG